MRFTIDRINALLRHYGKPSTVMAWGCPMTPVLDDLDDLAGITTHCWYGVGTRVKVHEDHIELGLPYFWLGREAEENR